MTEVPDITVGLRVPHELPGGAAGLRDFVARVEATGIDRQVASLAALAPGRLVFGVGLGGEDPAELRACGIDPATRGRRMDEALAVLRPLLTGNQVTMRGAFFDLDQVRIAPAPEPRVPIVIGGRSDAALRRVARHGDGWLGLWVSPGRRRHARGRGVRGEP